MEAVGRQKMALAAQRRGIAERREIAAALARIAANAFRCRHACDEPTASPPRQPRFVRFGGASFARPILSAMISSAL